MIVFRMYHRFVARKADIVHVTNISDEDVWLEKHQTVTVPLITHREIVYFKELFRCKANNVDFTVNSVHHKPTLKRIQRTEDHQAAQAEDLHQLNYDRRNALQLLNIFQPYRIFFFENFERFGSMQDSHLESIKVSRHRINLNMEVFQIHSASYHDELTAQMFF